MQRGTMWEGVELQYKAGNEEMNSYEQDWNSRSGLNRVSFNQSAGSTKHRAITEDEELQSSNSCWTSRLQ